MPTSKPNEEKPAEEEIDLDADDIELLEQINQDIPPDEDKRQRD